jgi:hypothetical protein
VFFEREWLIVSQFIAGREATYDECRDLADDLRRSGRGFVQDVAQPNVRVQGGRLFVLDFLIDRNHPDWFVERTAIPRALRESMSWD